MPFYLRKSLKFGPLRLNFSKSGVGYSVGMKGLRVGQDARGKTYLHAGRHGLYLRQTLGRKADAAPSTVVPTSTSRGWLFLPLGMALAIIVLGIVLPTPVAPASKLVGSNSATTELVAIGSAHSVLENTPGPPAGTVDSASANELHEQLESAAEPSPLKAALIAYRVTFDRSGRPLSQHVHRLQTAPAPALDAGACIELLRLIDHFRATALPTPSEEVTFTLTNALARYREAMVGCSQSNDSIVRQRLQMGTNLWLRSAAQLTALIAQEEPEQSTRGPSSVQELFSSIPSADPPATPVQYGSTSGGASSGRARACCKVCDKGQPCGNSCISWRYTCRQPPGCAC